MKRIIWLAILLWAVPVLVAADQGTVSIDKVNSLVSNYAIRAGMPARFAVRLNNTTGERCDVSVGFKISTFDGAVWDSVTIDSAGPNISGENVFIKYFDVVYGVWSGVRMGGDGTNPDSVGILGAGNRSKTTKLMPNGYNDTSLAVVVWMHDSGSVGRHICIDSSFWGVGGSWKWVGMSLLDYLPAFVGLPGHPYNEPAIPERIGSGYCFAIEGGIPPDTGHVIYVPEDYATIQEAIDAASNGDSILVHPGAYFGGLQIQGKSVTLLATDGPKATAIFGVIDMNLLTLIGPATSSSTIEGFRFQGGLSAIWCQNSGPLIRRNILLNQHQSDWAAIALGGEGSYPGNSPARIINNTIVGCMGGGISSYSTTAPIIMNNIIFANMKYGIHIDSLQPHDVSYNDVFGSPTLYFNVPDPGPGQLEVVPGVNIITFDLLEGSPCINAGNPDPQYSDPDGSRNDMGAIPFDGGIEPPLVDTLHVPGDFATIQQAIDGALNGTTILVSPGVYGGGINFNGKLITVKSTDGPLMTTITNMITAAGDAAIPSALVTFNHSETSDAVLEGFTLQGGWIGVLCLGAGPTIRGNLLNGQTVNNWAAISLAGPNFDFNATEGPAPAIIENNTITGSHNGGISTFSTVAPTIKNNIIAFNYGYGIHKQNEGMPLIISYNDIYGNGTPYYNIGSLGPGALALDPKLNLNKTLMATSPCINAGDPAPQYNDPNGSRNDMGAIPFVGDAPTGLINLVQWRASDGGNDHWYGVIPEKLYWVEADLKAKTFMQGGYTGYLATVTSPIENQFITDQVLDGAFQDNRFDNFFVGGRDIAGTWQWITAEPFVYSNWAAGEPNNVGIETALAMYGHYDTYSHAIPGTWNNCLPDGAVNQLHRYWSVVEFGPIDTSIYSDPIPTNEWISLYCAHPMLNGISLAPGTAITAYDPQGVLCGKSIVKPDGSYGFMLVYRDDTYTGLDEGAIPGDRLSFKIDGEPVTVTPTIYWTKNGDEFQTCVFERRACITLNLHEGWNLVSWNVMHSGPIKDLLAPIIDGVDLVMSFHQGGLVYDPEFEKYSTLWTVDYRHGYWIKMFRDATLEVCGRPLPPLEIIPVYPGWNLVSYLPALPMPPQSGFFTINDNLQVAIGYDNGARIYAPFNPAFNTLTELKPGFGYWLRMAAADLLGYETMPVGGEGEHPPVAQSTSGANALGSRVWMSLYGDDLTLDGSPLAANATLEVYTANDQLAGRGKYSDGVLKFMPVYGDDGDASSAKYAAQNDELTLKVDGIAVGPTIAWSGEGTSLRLGALTSTNLPSTFALEQNYPNPFNPTTTIVFALPQRGQVRLSIYNMLGQEIRTLVDAPYSAGQHEVIWDGRDSAGDQVPTGLYFYRFESAEISLTKKMLLLK